MINIFFLSLRDIFRVYHFTKPSLQIQSYSTGRSGLESGESGLQRHSIATVEKPQTAIHIMKTQFMRH